MLRCYEMLPRFRNQEIRRLKEKSAEENNCDARRRFSMNVATWAGVGWFLATFFWVVATQRFLGIFSPNLGEMIQFDSYFSNGLKPPSSYAPALKVMLSSIFC